MPTEPLAPSAALGVRDQRGDRGERLPVVPLRRGHAPAEALAAGGVERDDLDLRAAEIDAEAKPRKVGLHGRI